MGIFMNAETTDGFKTSGRGGQEKKGNIRKLFTTDLLQLSVYFMCFFFYIC